MPRLLHLKHEAFCLAYARGEHAGNFAASYEAAGYSPDNANAARLGAQPHIKQRVAELIAEDAAIEREATVSAMEKLALDREQVLSTLKAIGLANMFDYLYIDDDDRVQLDLTRLQHAQGSALKSLKIQYANPDNPDQRTIKSITVQMVDKRFALAELVRYVGLAAEAKGAEQTAKAEAAEDAKTPIWKRSEENLDSYIVGFMAELAAVGVDLRDLLDQATAASVVFMPPDGKPIQHMKWAKYLVKNNRRILPYRPVDWTPVAA